MGDFKLRDAAADRRMAEARALSGYFGRILAYPLGGHALAAIVAFTVLLWIGLQSILGIALLAIVAPWAAHYAEAVFDRTSQGQATPPMFGGDMIYLGSFGSLLRAGFSIAAAVGVSTYADQRGIGALAGLFIALYLIVMLSHLGGYVAFHRGEHAGTGAQARPITDEVRRMEQQQAKLAAVLKKIDEALHRNDVDAAGAALYAEPGGPADLRLFHEELFEQLTFRRNVPLIHAQGQRLITVLVTTKRVPRALEIAEHCYDVHRDFQPEQPAQAVVLAQQALTDKRDGLFERLTGDAAVRYKGDAAAVSLAFLTARFWAERKRDDARAREILKPLLAATTHPQHPQIAAYARALGT